MPVMKPERCEVCGALAELIAFDPLPRKIALQRDPTKPVFVCADCHVSLDAGTLRGFEFEATLADLMRASGRYLDIETESLLRLNARSPLRIDILARSKEGATILIECKQTLTIGDMRLREALHQLKQYGATIGRTAQLVLAVAARLSAEQKRAALVEGMEIWDLDAIAERFRNELDRVTHPLLRSLLQTAAALNQSAAETPETRLIRELRELKSGRADWSAYQKLVSRILERLFCPPLTTPIVNLSDEADVNRRDIILPNYAETGFWAFVRERYAADFIVVDAKNHTEAIGKPEALQMLNYLKRHGAGQLGIIVTRSGADLTCMTIVREHWAHSGKMVIVLCDAHIEVMLKIKEAGGPPEEVIRQWIEEFRLSM